MRTFQIRILIIALVFAGGLGATEIADPVPCEILQYQQGRLYFSAGEESRVYPKAPFAVCASSAPDTLITGFIEHSWLGVSVSFPIDSSANFAPNDSLLVLIESAAVDSTSTITIGTDIPRLRLFAGDSSDARLAVRHYDHHAAMDQDFRAGLLDGYLSFEQPAAVSERLTISEHASPYVATLIPNAGRACNAQGNLTTSLYYRFDHSRSPLYFRGVTSPQMCLRLAAESTTTEQSFELRPYPLDPERGRRLVENLPRPADKIRLYAGSPCLDLLAHYFGDILARDRLPVEITGNKKAADLYLEFLPISSRVPSTTVYTVQHRLVLDSVPGGQANEALRIGAGLAELIESAQREQDYYSYLDRMNRLMITDLGVFPLFRPTLFFSANKTLQGTRFDEDGFLDLSGAVKVILPQLPEEAP